MDEYIATIPMDRHLTARAEYMAKIMVEEMQKITPDVKVKAEAALMFRWSKASEPWYDGEGDLLPWEMVPKKRSRDGSLLPVEWKDLDEKRKQRILDRKHELWAIWDGVGTTVDNPVTA